MEARGPVTRPGRMAVACGWVALCVFAAGGCSGDRAASCGTGGVTAPRDASSAGTDGQDAAGGEGGTAGGQGGVSGAGGIQSAPPAWIWTVNCPDGHEPTDPVDYGRCAIAQALAEVHSEAVVSIGVTGDAAGTTVMADLEPLLDARTESYVAATVAKTTWVVGRDAVGAMYGALEIAERLRLSGGGALPLPSTLRAAPSLPTRALNIFLTMPETGETKWWFLDEQFWTQYLDLLAHSRLNVLDLHAMYDPNSTQFPNALLYLATAASTPNVGAPVADRERNLKMLNRISAMARARGVGVGLMTYDASTSLDAFTPGPIVDDTAVKTYVREATFDLATRAPGLTLLGFRIGETAHMNDPNWYVDTFVAGARQAGTTAALYTRTWQVPSKNDIVNLASAIGPRMLLESKYNAEQWGPSYAIAGGAFAGLGFYASYSYQNYLNPPAPWGLLFQIRAAGTHRIFRELSYDRTRRAVLSLGLSPVVQGFSLEAPHAFSPQRSYYHASAADQLSPWTFVRDDLMYLLWGRLGYDPTTPEDRFRAIAAHESGTDVLWDDMQAASDIVPWILTGHTCGFDSREFAPEMELGGDVGQWAKLARNTTDPPVTVPSCDRSYFNVVASNPFDTFAVASPAETAADLVAGVQTSRASPREIAGRVLADSDRAERAAQAVAIDAPTTSVLARDMARESFALAALGRYFAHKLLAATALGVFARTSDADWLTAARAEITTAHAAWGDLVTRTAYIRPFVERLRMGNVLGYDPFHWSMETADLTEDLVALDLVAKHSAAAPPVFAGQLPNPQVWLTSVRAAGPGPVEFNIDPATASAAQWTVRVRFATPVPAAATVRILWKPFESEKDFVRVAATRATDGTFSAVISGGGAGAMFAVEVLATDGAWRYPDPMTQTPYVSLAP